MFSPLEVLLVIGLLLRVVVFVEFSALNFEEPDLARIALLAKFVDAISLFHSHLYFKAFVFSSVPVELDGVTD